MGSPMLTKQNLWVSILGYLCIPVSHHKKSKYYPTQKVNALFYTKGPDRIDFQIHSLVLRD